MPVECLPTGEVCGRAIHHVLVVEPGEPAVGVADGHVCKLDIFPARLFYIVSSLPMMVLTVVNSSAVVNVASSIPQEAQWAIDSEKVR